MPFWSKAKPRPDRQSRSAPPQRKASAAAATGHAMWRDMSGPWPRWSYTQSASDALSTNPVVQRCLRLITESAASIGWKVYEDGAHLSDHPLVSLLACPNPLSSRSALTEAVISHLLLHGNAYIEKVLDEDASRAVELYVLRPDRVDVKPGASGWPERYVYKVGGQSAAFPVDPVSGASRILHLKTHNPLDDHYGQSALQAAGRALALHSAADGWSKALLENAARPSGALVLKSESGWPTLSEEQFSRLRAQVEENFQGQANAGRPMILEGGLSWQPMGFSPADMDFQATKQAAARDIALAFGVPPMLLGIPGDNTYANYQEANKALWRLTVLPLLRKLIDALNQWLVHPVGPRLELRLDDMTIPALAEDRDAHWRRIAASDFLSNDEKRALLNLPPVQGDVPNSRTRDDNSNTS
ncbi:MAG: phage portal protein [Pseudomonadota bacterium]